MYSPTKLPTTTIFCTFASGWRIANFRPPKRILHTNVSLRVISQHRYEDLGPYAAFAVVKNSS